MVNGETNTGSKILDNEQLYDVFLNFRGEDTRKSFTGNLFHALHNKRIKTFMYNDNLKTGNQILASIFKVLKQSRISIVVLSKNYPSYALCLDELVKIIECRERNNLLVLPIFYDVDPSDVRHQRGSFGHNISHHEHKHGIDGIKRFYRSFMMLILPM
ncbi:TMV resistance protein N-like [Vicia villosa]|uniref:TMV resistance protein N-like n=1 Tax=Vicia villosa TaxID=3911 RepID=UPI00273B94A7|nr:TMV resistance protein N-like [Vicia villosa]